MTTKDQIIVLRAVARDLLADPASTVLFPGWRTRESKKHKQILAAAAAVLGQGLSHDEGTKVTKQELGALVHYVADMMEK